MQSTKNHAVLLVHLSTALFALSAVFAKNMEVPVINIVAMRALLAALALGLVLAFFNKNHWRRLSVKEWGNLITLGGLWALGFALAVFFHRRHRSWDRRRDIGLCLFPSVRRTNQ